MEALARRQWECEGLRLGRGQGQATQGCTGCGQEFTFTGSGGKILEGLYLGSRLLFCLLCGMGEPWYFQVSAD